MVCGGGRKLAGLPVGPFGPPYKDPTNIPILDLLVPRGSRIALARIYAYQQQGEEKCREEAIAAIETTKRAVRLALDTGTLNFSLCHGLCGNAETLLEASRSMGLTSEDDDCKHLCEEVAHQGLERHAHSGLPWPCGTHTGETPGLMLGLAGIGHFYLRLANPIVPSVLLPALGIVPHPMT